MRVLFRSKLRQDFRGQDRCLTRTDMADRCHSLNDQRINARPDKLLCQRQCGGEADDLRTAGLDRFNAAFGRKSASQHHMPDLMSRANVDEVENLRMHGDEVYAERLARKLQIDRATWRERVGR